MLATSSGLQVNLRTLAIGFGGEAEQGFLRARLLVSSTPILQCLWSQRGCCGVMASCYLCHRICIIRMHAFPYGNGCGEGYTNASKKLPICRMCTFIRLAVQFYRTYLQPVWMAYLAFLAAIVLK